MHYELGDSVRIVASGQTGCICDVSVHNGKDIYIVELDSISELDELQNCNCGKKSTGYGSTEPAPYYYNANMFPLSAIYHSRRMY